MVMEEKYAVKDGKVPEGYVEKTCVICGTKFALPPEIADKAGEICESAECRKEYEKKAIEATKTLMKSPGTEDPKETIDKALGN